MWAGHTVTRGKKSAGQRYAPPTKEEWRTALGACQPTGLGAGWERVPYRRIAFDKAWLHRLKAGGEPIYQ